jgi:uncharacterized protein YceH (UPF0502 family)
MNTPANTPVAPHPMQPVHTDEHGTYRFRKNKAVRLLLDEATKRGFGMNELVMANDVDREDMVQFAQLIGYSLSGFGELSYVDDTAYATAHEMLESGESELQARVRVLEAQLAALRGALREPMATLFGVHPDDLTRNG